MSENAPVDCSEFDEHCARITNSLFKRVSKGETKTSHRLKQEKISPAIRIDFFGKYKVFAKQDIPPGRFLMLSTPLFTIHNSELPSLRTDESMECLMKKVSSSNLNDPFLKNLFFKDGKMRDILSHNSINSTNWFGVWKSISFLSHSCLANCVYYVLGDVVILKSALPIKRGDELTISYVSVFGSPINRERDLEKICGYKCDCTLCTKPLGSYAVSIGRDEMRKLVDFFYPYIYSDRSINPLIAESTVDSLCSDDNWATVRAILNNIISIFVEADEALCMSVPLDHYRDIVKNLSILCGNRFEFELLGLYSSLSVRDASTETLKELARRLYKMGDMAHRSDIGILMNLLIAIKLSIVKNPIISKLLMGFWKRVADVYFTEEISKLVCEDPLVLAKIQ